MKCEALTYSAHITDYFVSASAPAIMGRPASLAGEVKDGEAVSLPMPGPWLLAPNAVMAFWLWVSFQLTFIMAAIAPSKPLAVEPSHIWYIPSSDLSAPKRAVRVNRSMARKLRRLERLRPASYFDEGPYVPADGRELSPTQFLDHMIRFFKWSRVRVFGLGLTLRDLIWRAQMGEGGLGEAPLCSALITPD